MIKFFPILCFVLLLSFNTTTAQNFSTHQVKKGETVAGIAAQYHVTSDQIYALNPDLKKGIKPNTILIIPISKANPPKITETKELQGFKEHRVNRKETLYSLAKRYDVEEEDIKKHNTFLYANPLRKGDKLQIPVFKIIRTEESSAVTKPYIVQSKEGKWRIAYKFGISVKELEELNPHMGDTLQEGQQIYVPNIDNKKEKEVDEKYGYYKVLPKEGFYRLKIKLGLEQDQLEMLNPGLKETGLKEGMILKVPYASGSMGLLGKPQVAVNLAERISDYSTKHIAVMLPFRINRVDFDSITATKKSIKKDPYLNASLDFYSGVLMAIDSLKSLGISLKVDVYDTKYQVSEVSRIIEDNDFEEVDAVIGPLTTETFDKAAYELRKYNVPIISPIGTNLRLYENVFQSRPTDELLKTTVLNFIKKDSLPKNIVVISDSKNTAVANGIKEQFTYAKSVYSRKNDEGKDENYVKVDDIKSALKPGRNIVFLETQNDGFASNVTSILASLISKGDKDKGIEPTEIVLVTTNFNAAFESDDISNEHLSRLKFHFATYTKSYNDINNFVKSYEKQYKTTPDKRAVRGFDLTMDVVLRLVTSEDLYLSVNQSPLTEYIESKFGYQKDMLGGYLNTSVYLVKYDNLMITEVQP